jgi:hypothetical protein
MADGMLLAARGDQRAFLCNEHKAKLVEVLARYGLTLEGKATPARMIPASNSLKMFIHCRQCFEEKPKGISPRDWARLEAGWTDLGLQVRCARHERNLTHIDFQGHQHPANDGNDDAVMS